MDSDSATVQPKLNAGLLAAKTTFIESVERLPFGKRLPAAVYLWDEDGQNLPEPLRAICAELRARFEIDATYGILKFHRLQPKISFLKYPAFWDDPHPPLQAAVLVDLVTGQVRRDSYSGRLNPPILHRKETFLPPNHPKIPLFAALTMAEEAAGLLEETDKIGFRVNWERVLKEKGCAFRGHRLVQVDRAEEAADKHTRPQRTIRRDRTALARSEMSKPVKLILEFGKLRIGESLFDYGCGQGTDVRSLREMGFGAAGWDPTHAPENEKTNSDVVNLGFVLNVIEDPAERVEVLVSAWRLTRRLLVVSTLVRGQEAYSDVQVYGDGLLTRRQTFQKFFEPAEIQALIEDTLEREAVPVALGIYFVFRDVAECQDFLSQRTQRFIDWSALSHRLGIRKALRKKVDPYETHRELLEAFWESAVELGRVPRDDEFSRLAEIREACGSVPQAMTIFTERFGVQTFESARRRRREDTLVYLAASKLRKRVPFSQLSVGLQRNVRSFFGSQQNAEKEVIDLMFAAGDRDELAIAVQQLGFGWWDAAEEQFTIHRSLLDELPVLLRVYVECAARLFGNPREADLIKFHLRSRKLTFQFYDDFGATFPELRMRIKIDLPRLFVTVLEQKHAKERQLLYFKERFVPADFPDRAKLETLAGRMRTLGFDPATIGHGPTRDEFEHMLRTRNLTWSLARRPTPKAPSRNQINPSSGGGAASSDGAATSPPGL